MYLVPNKQKMNEHSSYARQALLNSMAVAALIILAPATALSKSMGQVWPLALMTGIVAAGMMMGLLLHKKLDDAAVVKIPFSNVPNVPKNGVGHNFKKAA